MPSELEDLELQARVLGELLRSGENIGEVQKASAELRLVNARLSEVRARIEASKPLDVGDPKEIAARLLRELPAIARTDAVLGREIRDTLIRTIPLQPGQLLAMVKDLAQLDAEFAETCRAAFGGVRS